MSFDIRIKEGDLTFGPEGDLARAEGTNKLLQDVFKELSTNEGGDPFNSAYGASLTTQSIGVAGDQEVFITQLNSVLLRLVERIQQSQVQQLEVQTLTEDEILLGVVRLTVEPAKLAANDQIDPRQVNVTMTLRTQDQSDLDVSFVVTHHLNEAFDPDIPRGIA